MHMHKTILNTKRFQKQNVHLLAKTVRGENDVGGVKALRL